MGTDTRREWMISMSLDEPACRDFLRQAPIGRLGVLVDGRPEIFPIAHAYDEETGSLVFPTHRGTKLESALAWPWVAFEVDGLDIERGEGWSVLVVGRAELVDDDAAVERARTARRLPWRAGPGACWLRIVPSKVTGRRLTATW